jgi:hypothetical protein
MKQAPSSSPEQMANALHNLGLEFIMGGQKEPGESLYERPADLMIALAQSEEARLRVSLIPLFLEHPEFSKQVTSAAQQLHSNALLTLKCYYSAAVFLQQKHHNTLNKLLGKKSLLPDLFSTDLKIEISSDPDDNLKKLARCQQLQSHTHINWLGTYEHAIEVWIKGLELQKA